MRKEKKLEALSSITQLKNSLFQFCGGAYVSDSGTAFQHVDSPHAPWCADTDGDDNGVRVIVRPEGCPTASHATPTNRQFSLRAK